MSDGERLFFGGIPVISRIEALNFSCLRYVNQDIGPFHVLVGPNASGKSTFLDVLGFLRDLVTKGAEAAVQLRSANFYDLVWRQEGHGFELAIEAVLPDSLRDSLEDKACTSVRYEVALRLDKTANRVEIAAEQALLQVGSKSQAGSRLVTPETLVEQRVVAPDGSLQSHCLFAKHRGPKGHYISQLRTSRAVPQMTMFLPGRSLLGDLPDIDFVHPVGRWLRRCLSDRIEKIELDTLALRQPSPLGQGMRISPDGANLPWVVAQLQRASPERFCQWIEHLQTALPDLVGVTTVERPEDRHRYLCVEYKGGLKAPSWMASNGTLRLIALTLTAYLQDFQGVLLVEEPENGLHPLAIETVYQSLSSLYDGQVMLATHSPLLVGIAKSSEVLCFSKDRDGTARIVTGDRHPELSDWHGEVDLGTLFASGVLG